MFLCMCVCACVCVCVCVCAQTSTQAPSANTLNRRAAVEMFLVFLEKNDFFLFCTFRQLLKPEF